ncbi:tol-pal system protein YbgF [Rhodoligotrophos defluvii]|uniref:tol-pal system protein YbgF n=1 Tax=Rhodoligotrophos defluvii TaxID=2561934 RepID=UPI0010C96424|nr:tol-pal system protein YbgF [Rhodoligotrophos defluvii]
MTAWAFDRRIRAAAVAVAIGCTAMSAGPAAAQSYDASAVANLNLQMGQLQEQMRMLAGQVQETSRQIQVLQDQIRRLQDDSEFRFQQLEKGGRSGSIREPGNRRMASGGSSGDAMTTGSIGGSAGQGQPTQLAPSYLEGGLEQLASSVVQDPSLDPGRTRVAGPGAGYGAGSAQQAPGPQVLGTIPADPIEARVPDPSAGGGTGGGPVNLTNGLQNSYGTVQGAYGSAAPVYGQQPHGQAGYDQAGSLVPEPVERGQLNDNGLAPPIASEQAGTSAPPAASAADAAPRQEAALTTTGGGPDKLYEEAYDSFANKRYGEAEQRFRAFLQRYAGNELAGNAQYWLGETYAAQGDYKAAAGEFLKGYQNYKKGRKAPDSLIGLAVSLGKLGQKDQACAAFEQVSRAFPSAKDAIKRATQESKKAGCV